MTKSVFTDAYSEFLVALVAARKASNLTQAGLARRLGKSQPWVSNCERGQRRVDLIEFIAIARALKRDPIEVFVSIAGKLPKNLLI